MIAGVTGDGKRSGVQDAFEESRDDLLVFRRRRQD